MNYKKSKIGRTIKLIAVPLLGALEILGTCNFTVDTSLVACAVNPVKKKALTICDAKNLIQDPNVFDGNILKIPEEFTEIDGYAFWGCEDFTEVIIPSSVTKIGIGAFGYCKNLTKIEIPNSVAKIETSTFLGCSSLVEVTIPNSVAKIEYSAFKMCSSLIEVTICNGVNEIGDSAFQDCSSLTEVKIPNSVTQMGAYSFWNCNRLTEVIISDSVTEIKGGTFLNCGRLTKVKIPNGVTKIGDYAFCGCNRLTEIKVPSSVTEFGKRAFSDCKGLNKVKFLETEGSGKTNLDSFIIGNEAFSRSGIKHIDNVPGNTVSTGLKAFASCPNLGSIIFLGKEISLGENCFNDSKNFSTAEFPNAEKLEIKGQESSNHNAIFMIPSECNVIK